MVSSDELLTREQQEIKQRAREVAEKYVRPQAAELDRTGQYPHEIMKKIVDYGLMGMWIPKEFGGGGKGVFELCLIVEELSRACGGVGVGFAVNALGSFPIILGGNDEQKERYLRDVATGKKYVAFALSEKESGSDAGSLKTKAWKDGDDYIVDGDKKWTTNANAAEIYTVFANTNPDKGMRGISAFIVEKGWPGFTIGKEEDKMGIRCVPVHETHFKNCRVPAKNLLGKEGLGFMLAMSTLDRARPGVASQAVGLAQGAFDLAMDYAANRKQFGQNLLSFQALQFMFADHAAEIEAARQLVYTSARAVDAGLKSYSKLSAMGKFFASDVAMKVTTDAVQIFGGYGYCRDYPIEKYMRDAKITQIYEGTNQIQRLVTARHLIKELASKD
ncbi:MAG TPA: acyl-CoA dehydrogenase family protein [Acidobacteriota bacterium]|nr:acyl-CoA dehydrogenase family protein [Acidobacteriota bacterium]